VLQAHNCVHITTLDVSGLNPGNIGINCGLGVRSPAQPAAFEMPQGAGADIVLVILDVYVMYADTLSGMDYQNDVGLRRRHNLKLWSDLRVLIALRDKVPAIFLGHLASAGIVDPLTFEVASLE
jgi:hypothetical protein